MGKQSGGALNNVKNIETDHQNAGESRIQRRRKAAGAG